MYEDSVRLEAFKYAEETRRIVSYERALRLDLK